MTKCFVLGVCAAVLAAAGQADAMPVSTLQAMGLGGATVVSDTEAAEVRGMGFLPISIAAGGSFAGVGHDKGSAGTVNGYLAAGKYAASGENFSEAGFTKSHTKKVNIGGVKKSVTTTKSLRVYAGGYSSSMSF
ncbi:MAG: hypothetical protein AAGF31_00625 [Planctomycetota bacterium]